MHNLNNWCHSIGCEFSCLFPLTCIHASSLKIRFKLVKVNI